jgi:N6-adenosine-specific RNA methylase IME4
VATAAERTNEVNELARLADATKALAEVSTARDAWTLVRTAEAARKYAEMQGYGHEAINYAIGIKAKAMILLADLVDAGQADGTIRTAEGGRPKSDVADDAYSLSDLLGTDDSKHARDAVYQARKLRAALLGVDEVDELIKQANAEGVDLGIRGMRRAAAMQRGPAPVAEPVPPPSGRYRCLVIDPPWPMPKIDRDERSDQGRTLDYATMTPDRLADEEWLPVRTSADEDCHIYLWVTHKFLPLGLELLEKWGFAYQCVMTWRKNVGITPYSWMYDTEHVLFGRRGNLQLQRLGLRLSFDAPVTGHSVKPDVFYDRVREASPGPRLDMFPGVEHDGFEPWGLEESHRANT